MRRASLALCLCSCFNLDADFDSYCARTGLCDGGTSAGGGSAGAAGGGDGGGFATGGGSGGGIALGGGSGGGGTGGASTDGGCVSPSECTSPLNGMATCLNGTCSFNCNPMFHRCSFSCVGDYDPNACGQSCTVCPNPSGAGTRACDAGVCDFSCVSGTHRCGDTCLSNTSTQGCGTSCQVCNVPTGGSAFCDGGFACDFNCGSGYVKQNGRCMAPPNITFTSLGDPLDPNTFIDARLDPTAPSTTVWALDFSGQMVVSRDFGQTFTPVCRLPNSGLDPTWSGFTQRIDTRLLVSPGPDRTAYATNGTSPTQLYRADLDGGAGTLCRSFPPTAGFEYGGASYAASSVTAAPDGTLYAYTSASTGGRIWRSVDRGTSWGVTLDAGLPATFRVGVLSAGPADNLLVAVTSDGLYLVTDAGTSVSRVSATVFSSSNDMMPKWSFTSSGYAFAGRGQSGSDGWYSSNGGRTWTASPAHAAVGDWSLDRATGAGYRFVFYDGGLNLERAPDLTAPTWSRTGGYWQAVGGGSTGYDRVDAVNGNIAVVAGHRLYLSSNGGAGFTRVGTRPPFVTAAMALDSDGTRVLLAQNQGSVFESFDQGRNYALKLTTPAFGAVSASTPVQLALSRAAPANGVVRVMTGSFSQVLVSHDSFSSASFVPTGTALQLYSGFAWAPATVGVAVLYNATNYCAASTDGGDAWSAVTLAPALPFGTTWQAVLMRDPTYGLAFDCNSTRAYRVNNATRTTVDVVSAVSTALGNDAPCHAEVFSADGGAAALRTRIVSRTGWLATSDDDGATFQPVTGASGGLTNCTNRRIASPASDRSTVITWCNASLAISRNGGVNWTDVSAGQNWSRYGCVISSLYPLQSQLLVTCDSSRPPTIVDY